jgi:hypothetical protein
MGRSGHCSQRGRTSQGDDGQVRTGTTETRTIQALSLKPSWFGGGDRQGRNSNLVKSILVELKEVWRAQGKYTPPLQEL